MHKKKILLVEDDEILAFTIKNILTKLNYDCIAQVDNGNDAFLLAIEHNPHLILMDISLEGQLSGIETAIKN